MPAERVRELLFPFSGFTTRVGGIELDDHGVTSVDIFFERALSVKIYVISIIIGMCMIFCPGSVTSV
jgi:hypothetical protein